MNIAIIGAGNIARHMAEAINGLDDNYVPYAIASRDIEKAVAFKEKYGFQKAYGSYEELACDPEVDLIYIATPHSHHYEHALLCIKHGKNVLVEKAFARNVKEAKEMINLAKENNVLITEAIWTRYMPSRKMLNEIIESGIIGIPSMITANIAYPIETKERLIKKELAGGSLLDIGIYPINFASMVFGDDIESVSGKCTYLESGVDCQENITIIYKDGRMASLSASMKTASHRLGIIYGDKGYIHCININNMEKIEVYDINHNLIKEVNIDKGINGYEHELIEVKECLDKGLTECPSMPHSETIYMMSIMESLLKEWGIDYL